jgi:hypothetical protein
MEQTKEGIPVKVMDWSDYQDEYIVELEVSVLWEAALGVAVMTWPDIHHALTLPASHWHQVEKRLSPSLKRELAVVRSHHTWKGLLCLLHQRRFSELNPWLDYIESLTETELRFQLLPYGGEERESIRMAAAEGDQASADRLVEHCRDPAFFPAYIRYVTREEAGRLKHHLIEVLAGWYRQVVKPEEERIRRWLTQDVRFRERMRARMSPEAFVDWVTDGLQVIPAPGVRKVVLIPQIVYRPWRIQATDRHTRIVYYPVADDSMAPEGDPDRPRSLWLQVHKALADEKRLRTLRAIRRGVDTLPSLAKELGLPKTTMHHHLTLLRSARLVRLVDNRYTLHPHTWSVCQKELKEYLGMEEPGVR